ncbi:MAG: hypothetical protein CMM32_07140 [Rhodospirillaceae bacterium]|nr:hypothetical protein [Rhodospirillaceae bacterium]
MRSHHITFAVIFTALIVTNWEIGILSVTPCHAEETIYVAVNKVEMVRADRIPSIVQVGNPKIADVNVASDKGILVLGISTGETSLILLDSADNIIRDINVVVIPRDDDVRRVTIHQGTTGTKSLDCGPKCVEVSGVKDEAATTPIVP